MYKHPINKSIKKPLSSPSISGFNGHDQSILCFNPDTLQAYYIQTAETARCFQVKLPVQLNPQKVEIIEVFGIMNSHFIIWALDNDHTIYGPVKSELFFLIKIDLVCEEGDPKPSLCLIDSLLCNPLTEAMEEQVDNHLKDPIWYREETKLHYDEGRQTLISDCIYSRRQKISPPQQNPFTCLRVSAIAKIIDGKLQKSHLGFCKLRKYDQALTFLENQLISYKHLEKSHHFFNQDQRNHLTLELHRTLPTLGEESKRRVMVSDYQFVKQNIEGEEEEEQENRGRSRQIVFDVLGSQNSSSYLAIVSSPSYYKIVALEAVQDKQQLQMRSFSQIPISSDEYLLHSQSINQYLFIVSRNVVTERCNLRIHTQHQFINYPLILTQELCSGTFQNIKIGSSAQGGYYVLAEEEDQYLILRLLDKQILYMKLLQDISQEHIAAETINLLL